MSWLACQVQIIASTAATAEIPVLGSYEEVATLCEKGLIDIVILADGRRGEEDVIALVPNCEKTMVFLRHSPGSIFACASSIDQKQMYVEALVAKPHVEALGKPIFYRPSRTKQSV